MHVAPYHNFNIVLPLNNNLSLGIIISPNEVFGDIMVLASPPRPRPPVDPDDMNTLTRQIFNLSLSNFMRVDTP